MPSDPILPIVPGPAAAGGGGACSMDVGRYLHQAAADGKKRKLAPAPPEPPPAGMPVKKAAKGARVGGGGFGDFSGW